uniref:Glutamate carboxypeptidase 2 homolog n=1 Tax=Caenorhabditis japonica TaxID=281687 RepID=A0A8R1HII9_CAEJA
MVKAYLAIGVALLFVFCIAAVGLHHSGRRFNKFDKVSIDDIYKTDSKIIQENIKSENIKKYLRTFTKEPHIAGSDANKKVAYAIASAWSEAGLEDVHTLPYEVLLSYPDFENPNTVLIQSSSGEKVFQSKGISPVILPDEQSEKFAGHQWLAYAGNGTVSADVVYVNRGSVNDFKNLKLMGVDVKGKIALMRYGQGFRGDKVQNAQSAGAVGAILFSDTSDVAQDGIEPQNVYPNKIWMPNEGVQRGSLMHLSGDALSPYYPSKKELFRSRTIEEAKEENVILSIPALPISYTTALQLLKRMKGRPVPFDWQGLIGGNLTYKLGPGFTNNEKLTINVFGHLKTKRIRNVIGYIRGSEEPDRYVMLGNHFDAWVYGSIDPNSGTAVLAEVARAMMQTINETSWRPARTIVFNAWDGEEHGLIGSTEFVEEFIDILQKRAVVYINMDCIQGNSSLTVDTVPMLEHVAIEAAKNVDNPSKVEKQRGRKTVYDTWLNVFPDKTQGVPKMTVPGGGSDHAPFLNYAGIPVINFSYKNYSTFDTYPLYHTMYETPFTNEHLLDTDNMSVHRAIGQYWAELAKTFSDEVVLPMNITHYASIMLTSYLPQLKASISGINATKLDFENVRTQYALLTKSAQDMLAMTQKFEKTIHATKNSFSQNPYDPKHVNAVNERLMSTERCFVNPRGVSKHNPSARHVLFSISDADSYSNSLMAGIQNAIDEYQSKPTKTGLREIINQISIVQYSVICVVNTLRDVI